MLIFGISIVEIIRISGFEQNAAKWYHALATAVLLIYAFSCVRMAFYGKGMEEHLEQEPGTGWLISQWARAGIKTTIISMLAWYASSRNFGETITIWLWQLLRQWQVCYTDGYWYGSKLEQADLFCRRRISFDFRHAHGGDTICIADRKHHNKKEEENNMGAGHKVERALVGTAI